MRFLRTDFLAGLVVLLLGPHVVVPQDAGLVGGLLNGLLGGLSGTNGGANGMLRGNPLDSLGSGGGSQGAMKLLEPLTKVIPGSGGVGPDLGRLPPQGGIPDGSQALPTITTAACTEMIDQRMRELNKIVDQCVSKLSNDAGSVIDRQEMLNLDPDALMKGLTNLNCDASDPTCPELIVTVNRALRTTSGTRNPGTEQLKETFSKCLDVGKSMSKADGNIIEKVLAANLQKILIIFILPQACNRGENDGGPTTRRKRQLRGFPDATSFRGDQLTQRFLRAVYNSNPEVSHRGHGRF